MKHYPYQQLELVLADTISRFPQHTALIYGKTNFTWTQLGDEVNRAVNACLNLGVRKGDHVALWSRNAPEFVIFYLALARIGAVAVLLNTSWVGDEIVSELARMDVRYLLCGSDAGRLDFIQILSGIFDGFGCTDTRGELSIPQLPLFRRVMYIGSREQSLFSTDRELSAVQPSDILIEPHGPQDISTIIFTSGTTAMPKGVMHCHAALINNAYVTVRCLKVTEKDRFCISLPTFHCFSLVANIISALCTGAAMVIPTKEESRRLPELIDRQGCTILHGVPTLLLRLANREDIDTYDLSTLRTGIIGGASYTNEQYQLICEKLKYGCLMTSLGQTEAVATITMIDPDAPFETRMTTVGTFVDGVEGRIVEPHTGKILPPGKVGELCIRSETTMIGYYKQPELTREVLSEDGWLHTGDLGMLDPQGNLILRGRLKEIVIRGGENISLLEVERAILSNDAVAEVKSVGVPDDMYGEEICACIVTKPSHTLNEAELRTYLNDRLAHYKVPRYFLFLPALPKGSTGKYLIGELSEIAHKQLGL